MSRLVPCLAVLLLCLPREATPSQEPALPERVRDDFATDSREKYQIEGDVTWKKGALTLGPGVALCRKLGLGSTAEVEVVLAFPAEAAKAELRLRLGAGAQGPLLGLRRDGGKVALADRTDKAGPASAVGNGEALGWRLRVHVGYGLLRAKAWPDGTAEPGGWAVTRYREELSSLPAKDLRLATQAGTIALFRLAVRGAAASVYSQEQQARVRRSIAQSVEGLALAGRGKQRDALPLFEEALTLRRQALPAGHPGIVQGLSNLANTYFSLGRPERAWALNEEALTLARKALPAGHPLLGIVLGNLGQAYRKLGLFEKARETAEQALAVFREALPADHPSVAQALSDVASAYDDLGRFERAQALHQEVLALRRRLRPGDHPEIVQSLNNLAVLALRLGQPERARALAQSALDLQHTSLPAGHRDTAQGLNNLAVAYLELGQPERAKALHEQALAVRRKALPAGHSDIANSLANLAVACASLGQTERSRALHEEALALRRQALPAGHSDIAGSLANLAATYRAEGQLERAKALHEQALALYRKALPADHPVIARGLEALARDYYKLGQPGKAVTLSQEALALRRRTLPAGHPEIAYSLNGLGAAYLANGQPEKARALFEEALALYRPTLPAHPFGCALVRNLAIACGAQGRWDEARRHVLHACALEADTLCRILAGSPQRDHLPLLASPGPLDLLLAATEVAPPPADGLREALGRVAARQALAGLAAQLRHEESLAGQDGEAGKLYGRLKQARQQLANLLLRGAPAAGAAGYNARCAELQGEQDRLERELTGLLKGYAPLAEFARPAPDRLAQALAGGEVLLHFVSYTRKDLHTRKWTRYYAALLLWRADGKAPQVRFVPLGEADPIDQAVRSWRSVIQKGGVPDAPDTLLREKLWGPLAQALPEGIKGLAVVPEGQLALLPLGALRQSDGSYLLERYAIRYLGAARDLLPAQEAKATGPAVLVSDPAYDLAAGGKVKAVGGGPAPGKEFRRLPGFAREAQAAAKLLRDRPGWAVRSLSGEAATEEALHAVKRPRLLYLITHGYFHQDARPPKGPGLRDLDFDEPGPRDRRPFLGPDPRLRSGLALAGANRWKERSAKGLSDGLLTAAEVENLDLLGTELVILSACETGLGEVQLGEGVLGLRRAFQLAGAQTVVASLWKVPDDQTEQLMTGFLKRWLDGAGKADALRQAQLALIRELRQSADPALRGTPPLYWAGFVCHGRPD